MKQQSGRDVGRRAGGPGLFAMLAITGGIFLIGELLADSVERGPDGRVGETEVKSDQHLNKEPVRQITGLVYTRGPFKYKCMECHQVLGSKWHLPDQLMEHQGLELKHGNNRFCLNCHHPVNRDVYVDYDGSEIPQENVVALCAKCHGPQHRDWMIGAHGRRNGYWDASKGKTEILSCIQCHDPHDPAFKAMKPLTAPTYPSRAAGGRHHSTEHDEETGSHGE